MTKTNSTKKTLLSSAFALLICVAMLIGTTFAWFTDTASTAVNRIEAGTLKVDIVDKENNSLNGKTLSFRNADGGTDILWEPGATFNLDSFKIVNKGKLALKYKVIINGVDGNAKLLKAIDFTVNKGNGESVILEDWEGVLLPEDKETSLITVSGHMKEEAGNEYQGEVLNGIGITVVATQYTYEKDSKDDRYDEDAMYPNAVTLTASDIAKTSFNRSNTTYYFVGEFDDLTINRENSVSNVAFIAANSAVFNGNVTIQYHAGDRDEKLAASSSLTIKGFNVNGNLTIGSRDKNVVVEGNSAKQIKLQMHDVSGDIKVLNNIMDGSAKYGFWLDPFVTGYDLTVTGNTFKDSASHAIAVQGSAGAGAVTAANSITVKNNTFNSYGKGKAAFKIWEDTVLAPNGRDPVNAAAKALAKSVEENNIFSDAVKNNCVVADFYGKTVAF